MLSSAWWPWTRSGGSHRARSCRLVAERAAGYRGAVEALGDVAASGAISVAIADDHALVRRGLRMLIDAEPDLVVVAEAAGVDAAMQVAVDQRPDVLVLDLSMPGRPTLPPIPELRAAVPRSAIVGLTMNDDPAFARQRCASTRADTSSRRRRRAS
jgi:CheY-like chemotaxis protein